MMKQVYLAAGLLLMAGTLQAQGMQENQGDAANARPPMPAVVMHPEAQQMATALPAKGHNSFTRKQAMSRIQKKGYSHVSGLTKDHNGVWRGTAMMNGAKQKVAIDYQGNVTGE